MKTVLQTIQELCRVYNIQPTKQRGQHFLVDQRVIAAMMQAAELTADETVIEVGPGLGILTEALAQRVRRVIAIEIDPALVKLLHGQFGAAPQVTIVHDDVLRFTPAKDIGPYSIVANVPYNITSDFLRHILAFQPAPRRIVLLLQREVVERMCAEAGQHGTMSMMSVAVQLRSQPHLVCQVPRTAFWPAPKVDSAVVVLDSLRSAADVTTWLGADLTERQYWRTVKIGFSARRKQLANNLAAGFGVTAGVARELLLEAKLPIEVRPQNLTLTDWRTLAKLFKIYSK